MAQQEVHAPDQDEFHILGIQPPKDLINVHALCIVELNPERYLFGVSVVSTQFRWKVEIESGI